MKATGIIRQIDGLGRVVIPKEIRRTMNLKEEDPMEIFVDGDMLIFKKYFPMGQYIEQAREYVRSFQSVAGRYVFVTDTEKVIASAPSGFCNAPLNEALIEAIRNKRDTENIPIEAGASGTVADYAVIIKDGSRDSLGEGIGAIILVQDSNSTTDEATKAQLQIAADFLGRLANADGRQDNV